MCGPCHRRSPRPLTHRWRCAARQSATAPEGRAEVVVCQPKRRNGPSLGELCRKFQTWWHCILWTWAPARHFMPPFEFATATRILFGEGTLRQVPAAAATLGRRALLVTGSSPDRAAPLLE